MSIRAKQVLTVALGLSAVLVGAWAAAAPHAFTTSFPLPGHHWVAPLGPYNEHLTRDVGGLYLALAVVSGWAVTRARADQFALTGAAWLVFGVPHLLFHSLHLDMFSTTDAVANVVVLGGTVVLAALLLLPERRPRRGEGRAA